MTKMLQKKNEEVVLDSGCTSSIPGLPSLSLRKQQRPASEAYIVGYVQEEERHISRGATLCSLLHLQPQQIRLGAGH